MSKKQFKTSFSDLISNTLSIKKEDNNNFTNMDKNLGRITLAIENSLIEKIRAIKYWERLTLKEVISHALTNYISCYEKDNGKIETPPKH